eukprot:6206635-Pleurochrysis_carterae.AAC.1
MQAPLRNVRGCLRTEGIAVLTTVAVSTTGFLRAHHSCSVCEFVLLQNVALSIDAREGKRNAQDKRLKSSACF